MADVATKAINANTTKNGAAVVACTQTGIIQVNEDRARTEMTPSQLDSRYTERFDDVGYA